MPAGLAREYLLTVGINYGNSVSCEQTKSEEEK